MTRGGGPPQVKVARPVENRNEWFSLLAVHQNRLPRGAGIQAKGYIKEQHLPSCIDLVVWGHEHECLIGGGMAALPESVESDFVVLQPGSSVATALVEGEARPKHVGVLSICKDAWQMRAIPLTTVRPFAIREVRRAHRPAPTPTSIVCTSIVCTHARTAMIRARAVAASLTTTTPPVPRWYCATTRRTTTFTARKG